MPKDKKIVPPFYFIIFLILSAGLHFVFPIKQIIFPPYSWLIGFVFVVFGGIIDLWADLQIKQKKTTVKPFEIPSALITKGSFKISRHPIYLGMVIVLSGLAIFQGSLIGFLFPILFVVLSEVKFIPLEEKNLEKIFGEKYLAYKRKVRRWL